MPFDYRGFKENAKTNFNNRYTGDRLKKLRRENGGSIVDLVEKVEPTRVPTLIVGLGGLGCKTLNTTKKKYLERVRESGRKTVHFLALDTCKEDIDNLLTPEIEEEEEYVPPVVSTPKQTTKKAPKQQVTDNKEAEQEKQQSQPKEEKQQIYIPIPNILTPNGDGYNDCWVIPDLEQYGKAQVQIFTVHSKRVFYTGNYRNDFCGAGLPDGDYFYIIVFRDINVTRRGVLVIQH